MDGLCFIFKRTHVPDMNSLLPPVLLSSLLFMDLQNTLSITIACHITSPPHGHMYYCQENIQMSSHPRHSPVLPGAPWSRSSWLDRMEDGPALGSVRAEKLQPTRWTYYPVGYSVFFKPKPELCVSLCVCMCVCVYTYIHIIHWDFPGGKWVKNLPAMQEMQQTWVRFLGWEDPLEKGMTTHSRILA